MLPFTPDQFFGVFADYNQMFAPVVRWLWVASLFGLIATWREPRRVAVALSYFLAALWLWNALAYHALLFSRVNPAAWLFSLLFAVQSLEFLRAARRRSVDYFTAQGGRLHMAFALIGYGMAYPFVAVLAGHAYPATPTFGVPCPTAIVTIGLLISGREAPPISLVVVPAVWAMIGGSAALLLGVWPDYVLMASGFVLTSVALGGRLRTPSSPRLASRRS